MQKINFDQNWLFQRSSNDFHTSGSEKTPVTLPHDAQILEPRAADYETGGGGAFFRNGYYRYEKTFTADPAWQDCQIILELEGVYQWAEVTLNGDLIDSWPYGYSGFLVDLTGKLVFGRENKLLITANNTAVPNSRWYSGAGIYRHVWLRIGGRLSIAPWGVQVKTPEASEDQSTVQVSTELVNVGTAAADSSIRHEIFEGTSLVASCEMPVVLPASRTERLQATMSVAPAKLWNVETPNLYTLKTTVMQDSVVVDSETTVFGIRKIEVDAKKGFRLNGIPMKIKGGCVHHDNGLLGSASFDRAEERKVELLKAAGFNAIRCAHNPPAPSMLDACDRLGMMVMDETFDCWTVGKNPNDYHLHFKKWWNKDTENMVKRDFNHPSIIMWSIGNEIIERDGSSDGYAWSRKQADLVRALDDSRPVTSALCGLWDEEAAPEDHTVAGMYDRLVNGKVNEDDDRWGRKTSGYAEPLDVSGYNYLIYRYGFDAKKYPDRVIAGTETFPAVQFQYWMETLKNDNVIGDFVWTSMDYLGEAGIGRSGYDDGSHDIDSSYPWHQANCGDIDICGFKRPQSYFRDIMWGVRTDPYITVHHPDHYGQPLLLSPWGWSPATPRWDYPGFEGKMTTVEVYACQDEVELLLNGKSLGRKPAGAAHENTAQFDVPYTSGLLSAVAYQDGLEAGRFSLCTAGTPAKLRLTADRTAINQAYGDLSYVTVEVLDAEDKLVTYADHRVSFSLEGCGCLQAVGSSNPKTAEDYFGTSRCAFEGRLMAVIKSIGSAGTVRLRAVAEGLDAAEITIEVK